MKKNEIRRDHRNTSASTTTSELEPEIRTPAPAVAKVGPAGWEHHPTIINRSTVIDHHRPLWTIDYDHQPLVLKPPQLVQPLSNHLLTISITIINHYKTTSSTHLAAGCRFWTQGFPADLPLPRRRDQRAPVASIPRAPPRAAGAARVRRGGSSGRPKASVGFTVRNVGNEMTVEISG